MAVLQALDVFDSHRGASLSCLPVQVVEREEYLNAGGVLNVKGGCYIFLLEDLSCQEEQCGREEVLLAEVN